MQPFCRALHMLVLRGSLAAWFPCCIVPSLHRSLVVPSSRAGASLCCREVCSREAKQALRPINCPNNLRNLPGKVFTVLLLPASVSAVGSPAVCVEVSLSWIHPGARRAGHDRRLGAGAAACSLQCQTLRLTPWVRRGMSRSGARETSREQQNWGGSGGSAGDLG